MAENNKVPTGYIIELHNFYSKYHETLEVDKQ